jgi:UDP-N-acetyl-D-glucosamine dehydrogenase
MSYEITVSGASDALSNRVAQRTAAIGIIGLGYVGLPLTLLFSEAGFAVTGFDIDRNKIEALNNGRSYIYRIPKTEIAAAAAQGFRATDNYALIKDMDAIIICVPTPLNDYHEPDLSYIRDTAKAIAPYVHAGQLIVLESTTYPGTTEEVLVPIIESGNKACLKVARGAQDDPAATFLVAFSPEREDPGNDTVARRDIPKVVGGMNPAASEIAGAVYNSIFNRVVPVSSPAVAEMTKLLENIYRCVNIALVNEFKMLCLRMGIDIWEVIRAASTKPFGFQPFYPGPGLGGHCIPVDPFYLSWKAKEWDFHTRFIELAGEINSAMPYHVVDAVSAALNQRKKALKGSKILALGVAYKRDIDDLRESPALTIIEEIQKRGGVVAYNDPYFPRVGRGRKYNLEMTCAPLENLSEYDCLLIVTDHTDYDYRKIVSEAQLVVDSRNATRGIDSDKVVHC